MMHVDKNVDGYVMDQNVDRISREIAYIPLGERIRSKCSSYMQPFFFFFWKKMSTRHAYQWSRQNEDFSCDLEFWTCFLEVRWIWSFGRTSQRFDGLKFGHSSKRSNGFEFWTCFPKVRWNWILDILPRGPMDLKLDMLPRVPMNSKFGRASQRSNGFEIWTCFPEVQWNWKVLFISMCVGLLP